MRLGGKDDATGEARRIVVRKSAEATRRERERTRREASRKGKDPTARILAAAAYTFLLTTVPAAGSAASRNPMEAASGAGDALPPCTPARAAADAGSA